LPSELSKIVEEVRRRGLDHDVLKRVTVIEGVAINETPIRVGKGRGELGEADVPILRDPSGVPYIPGSSLKGAMRAFVEALARSSGERVCTPFSSSLCAFGAELLNYILQIALVSSSVESFLQNIRSRESAIREIAYRRIDRRELAEEVINSVTKMLNALEGVLQVVNSYAPCVACRIFGNTALAARIVVFDSYPRGAASVRPLIRTRVAIDRLRGAARSGVLFEYEFVPRGYEWSVRIELKNIDLLGEHDESKVLRALLRNFADPGLSIGGMKSVGHGILKLDPDRTRVKIFRVEDLALKLETETTLSKLLG